MPSIAITPAAVERAANQQPHAESVWHRVRGVLVAGAVALGTNYC